MSLRKIGKWYYVCYYDIDGKLHNVATGMTTKEDAQVIEQNIRTIVQTERSIRKAKRITERIAQATGGVIQTEKKVVKHSRGNSIRLDAMFKEALTRNATLSEQHKRSWNWFTKRIGVVYADEVTPRMCLDYLNKYYGERSPKTWNNTKGQLNTVFRLCLVQAGLTESPLRSIADRHVDRREVQSKRNMTDSEIDMILADPKTSVYLKTMMMISRWTGLRLKECRRVTPDMFDFEKLAFIIDPSKTKRFDEWVCIPILPKLKEYLESIAHLIPDKNKPIAEQLGHVSDHALSKGFIDALLRLGIRKGKEDPVSFHSLRGSMITWLKENDIDPETRHEITGHDSDAVEGRYARMEAKISKLARSFYGSPNT